VGNRAAFTCRGFYIFVCCYQVIEEPTKQEKMKITSVVLLFLLFTLITALPPLALQYGGYPGFIAAGFWIIFFFMSGLTLLLLMGMLIAKQKGQEYFTPAFLAGTTVKILACLIFIFAFLAKYDTNKHVFLSDFLYIYLLNTVFEIYVLLRSLRHKNLR